MTVHKSHLPSESMSYRTTRPGAVQDVPPRTAPEGANGESKAQPTNQAADTAQSVTLAGAHLTVRGRTATLAAHLDHGTAADVLAAIYAGVASGRVRLVEEHRDALVLEVAGLEVAALDLADTVDALVAVAQPTRWTDLEREWLEQLRADLAAFRAVVPL